MKQLRSTYVSVGITVSNLPFTFYLQAALPLILSGCIFRTLQIHGMNISEIVNS